MGNPKDGGAAFPEVAARPEETGYGGSDRQWRPYSVGGMSLRDYFAGRVLSAILGDRDVAARVTDDAASKGRVFGEYVAETAYLFADAMLAEREKCNGR
jgi:hypothetical protein